MSETESGGRLNSKFIHSDSTTKKEENEPVQPDATIWSNNNSSSAQSPKASEAIENCDPKRVPLVEEGTFVHVSPSFSVIQCFDDLEASIKDLHRRHPSPSFHSSMNTASAPPPRVNSDGTSREEVVSCAEKATVEEHKERLTSSSVSSPRVLCFWDIDDTLVTAGDLEPRQHLMFEESQLLQLFQSMPTSTRHLLLSQGSVDDVFAEGIGPLYFLRKYFLNFSSAVMFLNHAEQKNNNAEVDEEQRQRKKGEVKIKNDSDFHRSSGSVSCCSSLSCVKEFSFPRSNCFSYVPIHLTRVDSSSKELSCGSSNVWGTQDQEGNAVRWLLLRPGLWGISLARLSSLVPPSPRTAFIDGKLFKKMDIVWSFAASGYWDKVFFIDNNLCEVGIVKYGMSYYNASGLLERRRADKVFLSHFSLLRASESLYRMEKERGARFLYGDEQKTQTEPSFPHIASSREESEAEKPTPSASGVQKSRTATELIYPFPASSEKVSATGNACDSFSQGTFSSVVKEVQLLVCHLHLYLLDYYRVRHRSDAGGMEMSLAVVSRQSGHPTFFENQCCTDEQYDEFISSYSQAETVIHQIVKEDLGADGGTVGNDWKSRWRPNSSKVILLSCRTVISSLEVLHSLCARLYEPFISVVCARLEMLSKEKTMRGKMAVLAGARKAAFAIYVDLWTLCPLIDPLTSQNFALALYQIYCTEVPPSKRTILRWRNSVECSVFKHGGTCPSTALSKDKQ